ncbi:FtsQ-type POTRA domain-containing protein [Candidatus Saganbacteria bacterium]|uniref:FtsQ-type POTRA domain-containing protein n=1 Tax=Candidatus Saganbacteria bacterium TaxID=2575572 RepID=A0A9D6UKA3_UNCSA|nr:FtsQ-type POTRA domain-containing protein [Candidatus Saganbacteria bacterium]
MVTGIAGYYALSLPIWRIQEVAVDGTKMLSADEVRAVCGIPLSENLFLSSFSRASDNLKKISAVKNFRLYRIPPAAVLIKIVERKPIAVVVLEGESAVVDDDGFILNRNPNLTLNIPNMTDLPVISGVGTEEVISGERLTPKASRIVAGIILKLSNLVGSRRIKLEMGSFENISLLLDDILRLKLGREEELERKMQVFGKLLSAIAGKWDQVEYVDVRYPDNPVIKFKS